MQEKRVQNIQGGWIFIVKALVLIICLSLCLGVL